VKILHRYVLKELAGPFVMAVGVLTFVLILTQVFRLTDLLINQGVSGTLVLKTIASLLPSIATLTIPMAMLLAVILAFGRLSADREVMAIRTSGIHMMTIYWPALVMAFLISVALLPMTMEVAPASRRTLTSLTGDLAFSLTTVLQPGRIHDFDMDDSDDAVSLTFEKRSDQNPAIMERVTVHLVTGGNSNEPDAPRDAIIILARRGELIPDRATLSIRLELEDGELHSYTMQRPNEYSLARFDKLTKMLPLDVGALTSTRLRAEELTGGEVYAKVQEMKAAQANGTQFDKDTRRYYDRIRTEWWQRISLPWAALAFTLVGAPLGLLGRTSAKPMGFAIGFLLIFLYYIMLKWGTSLGEDGNKLAPLAIFSPNIVLGILGTVLLVRTIRR